MTHTSDGVSWHVELVLMENECQFLHCCMASMKSGNVWDEMCVDGNRLEKSRGRVKK